MKLVTAQSGAKLRIDDHIIEIEVAYPDDNLKCEARGFRTHTKCYGRVYRSAFLGENIEIMTLCLGEIDQWADEGDTKPLVLENGQWFTRWNHSFYALPPNKKKKGGGKK